MKKRVSIILALMILAASLTALTGCFSTGSSGEGDKVLRVHIRADDNSQANQDVKYKVKEVLVEYLTPVLSECPDKAAAQKAVGKLLKDIEKVCVKVLSDNGFAYGARASLKNEHFPARSYDDVTLPEGDYDALIIELGSGKGDNWWCMVYPPMCFTGGESNGTNTVVYKSKIMEIIEEFKKKFNKDK